MPTYRSITIELRSQYDILLIPEYAPPSEAAGSDSVSSLKLKDDESSRVSVYVPVFPSSQFWICYSISPPYPPSSYFYFKLFINHAHVVSWGCGKGDDYRGKTMYGLYATNQSFKDEPGHVEKRALLFAKDDWREPDLSGHIEDTEFMEIRICRSNGRKRIAKEVENFKTTLHGRNGGSGIDLPRFGVADNKHPQRFYKYALLDPVDQPFATFRYYYRTWAELRALGIAVNVESPEVSILASEGSLAQYTSQDAQGEYSSVEGDDDGEVIQLDAYERSKHFYRNSDRESMMDETGIAEAVTLMRRLSIPPTRVLLPPPARRPAHPLSSLEQLSSSEQLPSPTVKNGIMGITAGPEAAGEQDRMRRTPSPMKAERIEISSPEKRKNSVGMLRGIAANALRRRVASEGTSD